MTGALVHCGNTLLSDMEIELSSARRPRTRGQLGRSPGPLGRSWAFVDRVGWTERQSAGFQSFVERLGRQGVQGPKGRDQ